MSHSTKRGNNHTRKKTHSATLTLKNTTPPLNAAIRRDLEDSIKKTQASTKESKRVDVDTLLTKSYSPTVNQLMDSLQSLSPYPNLFGCEQYKQIRVQKKSKMECVDWDTSSARNTMLKNLRSKKINFSKVTAPGQILTNCWFNVFFIAFFISDKGRKFFRYLRQSMITGELPDGTAISEELKWPFFLLNTYIEASVRGKDDPIDFAETMNTNTLIVEIGNVLKKRFPKGIPQPGEAGNPIHFYSFIMRYLRNTTINIEIVFPNGLEESEMKQIFKKAALDPYEKIPHIIAVYNDASDKELNFKTVYEYHYEGTTYKYVLDSNIILSIDKQHYAALVTGGKKDYAFDGASFSRLTPFSWKNIMDKDKTWKFEGNPSRSFNFKKSTQFLMYYRAK